MIRRDAVDRRESTTGVDLRAECRKPERRADVRGQGLNTGVRRAAGAERGPAGSGVARDAHRSRRRTRGREVAAGDQLSRSAAAVVEYGHVANPRVHAAAAAGWAEARRPTTLRECRGLGDCERERYAAGGTKDQFAAMHRDVLPGRTKLNGARALRKRVVLQEPPQWARCI